MLSAQARLNKSEAEIRESFSEISFREGETKDGIKYLMGEFSRGIFIYYFDEFGYSNLNLMVPYNIESVNEQVEIYNSKYVIINKTSWRAYLDNGMIMSIEMIFDDELQKFVFKYSM